jgi:DNA polymerase III subunit delta
VTERKASGSTAATAPVHLRWGHDEFLLRAAALELFGDVRPREVDAAEWEGGETADLATPSLFGEARGLLVSNARAMNEAALAELRQYVSAADPNAILVLTATVGERAKPPAGLVKLVEGVGSVAEVRLQRKELGGWIAKRATATGANLAPEGVQALIETIGEDPAALEQALEQLVAAFPGERITRDLVTRQFRGLGDQHMWDLCDKAFSRDMPGAMRSLRTLLEARDAGLPILGAIVSRLRDLMRVRSLPDRVPLGEIARQAGLRYEWQARRYRDQARRFSLDELVQVHERVAWADRALKSGATDDVVLPLVIAAIAGDPVDVPVTPI